MLGYKDITLPLILIAILFICATVLFIQKRESLIISETSTSESESALEASQEARSSDQSPAGSEARPLPEVAPQVTPVAPVVARINEGQGSREVQSTSVGRPKMDYLREAETPFKIMDGIHFPIKSTPINGRRLNLLINVNSRLPEELLKTYAVNGLLNIHLWRARNGITEHITVLHLVPNYTGWSQVSISPEVFKAGDIAIIEWMPGLMVEEDGNKNVLIPMISDVEPGSSDPTRLPAYRAPFTGIR